MNICEARIRPLFVPSLLLPTISAGLIPRLEMGLSRLSQCNGFLSLRHGCTTSLDWPVRSVSSKYTGTTIFTKTMGRRPTNFSLPTTKPCLAMRCGRRMICVLPSKINAVVPISRRALLACRPQLRLFSLHQPLSSNTPVFRSEYDWVDGAENIRGYQPGGFHPVMVGDLIHQRYRVVDKLGFGGYSTIWLAWDNIKSNFIALKVGIADSPQQETKILRDLAQQPLKPLGHPLCQSRESFPILLDEFDVQGPNGTHPCHVMRPAQCDLRTASENRVFPLEVTRALSAGLAISVAYLHTRGYVHGGMYVISAKSRATGPETST